MNNKEEGRALIILWYLSQRYEAAPDAACVMPDPWQDEMSHFTGPLWWLSPFTCSMAERAWGKADKGAREQNAKSGEKEAGKLPRQTEWRRLDENSNRYSQNERLKQSAIFNRTAQLNVAGELKFWRIIELGSNFNFSASSLLTSCLNVGVSFSKTASLHLACLRAVVHT